MTKPFKPLVFALSILFILTSKNSIAQDGIEKGSYFNKTKLNILISGDSEGDEAGLNLSTVHGLNFSEKFSAGIGVGITGGMKYPSTIVPLFVNGTFFPIVSRKLYLSGDFGYSIATEQMIRGGMLGELAVGWRFKLGRFALAPELGYRYDKYKSKVLVLEQIDGNYVLRPSDNFSSSDIKSFSAGISFFF